MDTERDDINVFYQREPDASKVNRFISFSKRMPSDRFGNGINWALAESEDNIKLVDYIAGISPASRPKMKIPTDVIVKMNFEGMPDVIFSHKKHMVWGGCKLCHPEIFSLRKSRLTYSMDEIFKGKSCGVCHRNVAFPESDCRRCHTPAACDCRDTTLFW